MLCGSESGSEIPFDRLMTALRDWEQRTEKGTRLSLWDLIDHGSRPVDADRRIRLLKSWKDLAAPGWSDFVKPEAYLP
jgi:hypothetical protein